MKRSVAIGAAGAVLLALGASADAASLFASRGVSPKYQPKPCTGEECRGDDPRSGQDCKGFICSFATAKSLQRPVTAAEAAEIQAKAEATPAASAPTPTDKAQPAPVHETRKATKPKKKTAKQKPEKMRQAADVKPSDAKPTEAKPDAERPR